MANERLRGSIAAAGLTLDEVAAEVKVDPKTVERWITQERAPHRTHRWKTAQLLGKDEAYLWPQVLKDKRTINASEAEMVKLYPHRGAVSHEFWQSLMTNANDSIDMLVYAGLFMPDNNPELAQTLIDKAKSGVRIRILLGDPDGNAVVRRGEEEHTGSGMAERIRMAMIMLEPAINSPDVYFRLHDTTLYNSLFRSDETMMVNMHIYGIAAVNAPVMHLQRIPGGRMFTTYQACFERVWDEAQPFEKFKAGRKKAS